MEVRLAVLADYAAVTDQGKLVIAGIFDTITAPGLPSAHSRVSLALRVHLLPEEGTEHNLSVRYVDPDGNTLLDFGGPIPAPPQVDAEHGSNAQLVINFEPLPLEAYGRHAFEVFVDDEYVDAVPLEIVQMNLSSQEPGTRH
jgi:hypothetical protein